MRILFSLRRYSHTLETHIEANAYQRKDILAQLRANPSAPLPGHFDFQGSSRYQLRHEGNHYKPLLSEQNLKISSIGVGSYKGSLSQQDDLLQFNGLVDSLNSGINVVDSCRNFRGGRSQKIVGEALRYLIQKQEYERNQFLISSKAGYVREALPAGVTSADVVNDHCVHPVFLQSEIAKSLSSLGLKTIDVYYLNNFAECQGHQEPLVFEDRMAKAFQALEKARAEGKIRSYGLSSWQAFRLQTHQAGFLSLEKVLRVAEKVGGTSHGFKFLQLPINIFMPQAFAEKYKEGQSLLDLAEELRLNVVSNSPLLSGSLINVPMQASLLKCNHNGAKHLQLIRSIPSRALVSTLVGQKLSRHVRKNLEVLSVPPLDEGEWLRVFVPAADGKPEISQREQL